MDTSEDVTRAMTETSPDEKEKKQMTVMEKMRDAVYRRKVMHSVLFAFASFALGIAISMQGPSFLDLQIITNTNVETASAFYTSAYCGYLVGSFISGFLHGKLNSNMLMFCVTAGVGLGAIFTPYCSPFFLMCFIRFLTNLFCGGIDTLVNAEHMRIWRTEGEALLQFIHFTFAFAGVFSPLFTEPFLAKKITDNSTEQLKNISVVGEATNSFFNQTNLTRADNMTVLNSDPAQTTKVHTAFLIAGLICILVSLPFLVLICVEKNSAAPAEEKYTEKKPGRRLPRPLYAFLILTLCFLYLVYCCVEDSFASFLMTFLVKEYDHVSKSKGAYVTTFYWGAFAAGRFSSIFIAKFLSSLRMVTAFSFLMVIAYSGFAISAVFGNIDALTGFSCLAGIAMAPVFPGVISWTEVELFRVTGWISSFILIGSSIGMMINPLIIGYLMQEVSNMWFCYLLVGETILMCFVFLFLFLFNRCYINKIYGLVSDERCIEKVIDAPGDEQASDLMMDSIEEKPIA